ncbi:MAG TPA: hypothetical protein VNO81_12720 [Candidatus Nitrosotenuis sp.]|jgi:tetratricopeptide (TPR) repeat protein|nr:hypothetical protein [Candidatus Nitrosotenuis sp.]
MKELPDLDELVASGSPAETEGRLKRLIVRAKRQGDSGYLSELFSLIGRSLALQGRFEEAFASLNEAEFILMTAPPPPPARSRAEARLLLEQGRAFALSGWKESALEHLQRALDRAREAGHAGLEAQIRELLRG